MVRIIVFVPSPDMLKPVQQQAAEWENDEISINVVHRFGTPDILYQLDNYDVIVARGITYNKICNIYPEKHITRLRFDGMDLVEALMQLDNEKLAKAEKYIKKLLSDSPTKTYDMPSELLNALLNRAENNKKSGNYIEEQEMSDFIKSLQ